MSALKNYLEFTKNQDKTEFCQTHGEYHPIIADHPICPACAEIESAKINESQAKIEIEKQDVVRNAAVGIPARYVQCGFKNYEDRSAAATSAKSECSIYAKSVSDSRNSRNIGSFVITGATGTGKTHLACAIIRNVMYRKQKTVPKTAQYITSADAVDQVLGAYKITGDSESAVIKRFVDSYLLVIDEVGLDDGRDTQKSALSKIIYARYNAMKPVLIVSNLNKAMLKEFLGDRLWSRISENGRMIELNFDDQRVGWGI